MVTAGQRRSFILLYSMSNMFFFMFAFVCVYFSIWRTEGMNKRENNNNKRDDNGERKREIIHFSLKEILINRELFLFGKEENNEMKTGSK